MTTGIPSTQRALLFNTSTNSLSLSPTHPVPFSPNRTLIRVQYTTITRGELTWAPFVNWPTLHIPCYDVCGTIVRLSDTLSASASNPDSELEKSMRRREFNIGDLVYGRIEASREGAAAQFAELDDSEIAHVPEGLAGEDAVTVPMSGLTAWQALFSHARLPALAISESGEVHGIGAAKGKKRVLILGAAGAVGQFGVQFAKLLGAYVVGTASAKNAEFLRELGCDEVLDYKTTSIASYVAEQEDKKFDTIFDCAGSTSMLDAWNGIAAGGAYVSIVPGFREPEGEEGISEKLRLRYAGFFVMQSKGEELDVIGKLVKRGLVKTKADSVYGLEEYESAFRKVELGATRGKIVLRMGED